MTEKCEEKVDEAIRKFEDALTSFGARLLEVCDRDGNAEDLIQPFGELVCQWGKQRWNIRLAAITADVLMKALERIREAQTRADDDRGENHGENDEGDN